MAELRRHGEAAATANPEGAVVPEEVQPLVGRALDLAAEEAAPLARLAELAEVFEALRLRLPLRDMLPDVKMRLAEASDEDFPAVLRLLTSLGRGSLFFGELFEFCLPRLPTARPGEIADFAYEAGRHGLRSRNYCDQALQLATEAAPDMTLNELMRTWQGFARFSRDRRDFFAATLHLVKEKLAQLDEGQLLLALRVARDGRGAGSFVDLHAACCVALMGRMDALSVSDLSTCLMLCTFAPRLRAQAQALVLRAQQRLSQAEDLAELSVTDVVSALETLSSWGLGPSPLIDRFDKLLVDSRVEMQYSSNLSLWVRAVESFAKMKHFEASWPEVAIGFARDPKMVEGLSFFQQVELLIAYCQVRRFDEAAFATIGGAIASDIGLFKKPEEMAAALLPCAEAGCIPQALFDGSYDLLLEWMDTEAIDLSRRVNQTALVQLAWAFTVAGFHQRLESFAAVLDYALFTDPAGARPEQLRRLVQLADAVVKEAPSCAANCQYPERLRWLQTDPRPRQLVSADPAGDPALLQEVRVGLQELGWSHGALIMPDADSPFRVDVSLEPQLGRKVGILLAGKSELLRVGLAEEALPAQEVGRLRLARRLLAARGWSLAVLHRTTWSTLSTPAERAAFLERVAA